MGDPVAAESFRVSKVASAEGETTERFELERDGEREVLFVEKQAIVSTADVESAKPSPVMAHALEFRLTEQGGEKLHKATKDVVPGVARFAILIDGKLVMAPVLNATLARNFIVEGLDDVADRDLSVLGWRIEGRSDEEIARLLRELDKSGAKRRAEEPKTESYDEEEYRALKRAREKIGLFYLDELPTEDELKRRLNAGMSEAQVVSELGRASRKVRDAAGGLESLEYDLAPERRDLTKKWRPDGIRVHFHDGKVTGWGVSRWTGAPREGKPQGRNLRRLHTRFPGEGFADETFGRISWVEGIELSLKGNHEKPHLQDYDDLISFVIAVHDLDELAGIKASCPVVKFHAEGFSEVEELSRTSKGGRIQLSKLQDLLRPYLNEGKPFPESIVGDR